MNGLEVLCKIATVHRPRPRTIEHHHIVPQAWQHFHSGAPARVMGKLWAPETVTLCPTHHRNVHHWIVVMMHDGPVPHWVGDEANIAALALAQWTLRTGRPLDSLRAAGLWGEA